MATIKITQLDSIGTNLTSSTVIPVVNMTGAPTTEKTLLGNIANVVLMGAGNVYSPAGRAILAQSVTNAAQPNITSVGTLTNLAISGNASVNGNITSNGTAFVGNISTTGLASITTLNVGTTANLGAVGNVKIAGGADGYVLQTDGTGNLSWTAQTGGGGNGVPGGADTQVQFNDAGEFGANAGFTFNKTTGVFTSPFLAGNGNGLSNIHGANISGFVPNANIANTALTVAGANVSGFVPNANVANTAFAVAGANVSGTVGNANLAQFVDVSDVNNNFSYHVVLSAGSGDKSLHIDADDNLQYNPADGILTVNRVDTDFLEVQNSVITNLIPFDSLGLSLGNATNPWQDLYLSNSTLYLGDATITANGNSIVVDSITINNGNVGTIGNIASINLTGSNSNVLYGNGVFAAITGGGGNGTPGGSNTQIQFNDNGNFGANSGFTFDSATGNIGIPGIIIGSNTIEFDNRATGNSADINLYSADDILIQAGDRAIGSTSEGGDINIYAGDSAEDSDSSGGDVVIEAGRGGASNLDFGGSGGFVRVEAGRGGAASANYEALSGGSLTLTAGDAGTNNGNIFRGSSGGDVTINAGDSTGNGDPGGEIILNAGLAGANALAGRVQINIPSSDVGPGGTWTFNGEGIIQLPNSGTIGNDGNNIDIGSSNAISLEASSVVNIYTDTNTAAYQWQFGDDGKLTLPTIELDVGNTINEQTVIQSQRKIIPGLRYSAEIIGTTPTVVYTATSVDTTSMKVTMQIQHTGLGFEFFDVSATSTGGNTFYTVSNRVQPPTISNSTVVVDLNGSNTMEITVTITSGAANSWVTYDATEFGIAVD